MGEQETFSTDTIDESFVLAVLRTMTDRLCRRLREDGLAARTVTLRIRYNDMEEAMRSDSLDEPTPVETDFYPKLAPLLQRAWLAHPPDPEAVHGCTPPLPECVHHATCAARRERAVGAYM